MTNSEAQSLSEGILLVLKEVLLLTQDKPKKFFMALTELLEEVRASCIGTIDPYGPLETSWSLIDTSLLEILRQHWLPRITDFPPTTDADLSVKYSVTTKEVSN